MDFGQYLLLELSISSAMDISCDDPTVVIRFFQESLSFPQFPPFMDNERASLVIAFLRLTSKLSPNFHNSVLTNFHINNNTCLNKYNNKFILEYDLSNTSTDLAIATVVHYGLRSIMSVHISLNYSDQDSLSRSCY